jgi:uncharacterized repeat protein (TIGR01451 family)
MDTPLAKLALTASLLLASAAALAAPEVSLDMSAEKMVEVTNDQGETVTRRQAADNAEPGEVIHYTIEYRNSGDEAATNVEIDNPLPDGTVYVPDSAWGEGTELLFSIDDGQTFKKPASLTYTVEEDGESRSKKAEPERYSTIRWVVDRIPPGTSGEVGFEARVQ